ncbi:chorismate--pyruvate lyase family protein [Aidingimonas halophila]|uniref:Probable chorismate pyruvate-lyase n=1 Tax=Aidingimonas halophila TaxID=574349 RepID=A0A1H2XD35_9GAMM|nr:chorismate lyase [Aidingimonas halophila]SDW90638.1 chorismate lyase [Aidingimonas halophila]
MHDGHDRSQGWLPDWRPADAWRADMSPDWWQWVASRDSLTSRLIEAAGDRDFRVRLIDQRLGRPRLDEARALALDPRQQAWLREVALCIDERPWVVARSVAPMNRLQGQRLAQLGERSLGSWLFRQPDLQRSRIEVTHRPAPFFPEQGPWGRRSVFQHGRFKVLVQEFFLDRMADDLRLPSR